MAASADDLRAVPTAERAVVGCILREPGWAADEAGKLLRTADFLGHVERLAFDAGVALAAAGVTPEPTAVYERLRADGHARCLGDDPTRLVAWLGETFADQPTAANLEYFAKLVRRAADARALVALGGELVRDAADQLGEPADLAGRFADRLADLAAGHTADEPVRLGAAALTGVADLRARRDSAHRPAGVPFGYVALDRLVPAMEPGQLVVLGARPGVGKTALALTVAVRAALTSRPVLFFSLEMPADELGLRAVAAETGTPVGPLRAGGGAAADLDVIAAAGDELAGVPVWVDDRPGRTVEAVVAAARRHRRRHGLGLAVVDYLQLVEATDRRATRREQVEHVSRQLKRAARALRVPVLALCQLNREVEGRGDPKPRMSDIREAGGIEQDADVILLAWEPAEQPHAARGVTRVGVTVVKNRHGPTGDAELLFRKGVTRFEDSPPGGP